MTENVPMLIQELYTWESQTKWPPNKHQWQRALVQLGEPDQWNRGGITVFEAKRLYQTKGKRDKPRWARIYNALFEAEMKKPETILKTNAYGETKDKKTLDKLMPKPKHKLELFLTTLHIPRLIDKRPLEVRGIDITCSDEFRDVITKGTHTPDTDPRAVATLKREIKNKDELIAQKKREYEDLLNKKYGTTNAVKETLNKEINRLRAENIRQQQKAQKYYALYEDATHKLDSTPDSDDVQKLEQQVYDLNIKLHEANNKLANNQIDFQTAISGLMSGRVIPPNNFIPMDNYNDKKELLQFSKMWKSVLDNLPDTHVFGMKNHESAICVRHGIKIDDYGQPICHPELADFARTLQYLDNAIAHVHQELQAAARVAREISE